MTLRSINPTTARLVASYETMDDHEVAATIDAAQRAFLEWRERSFDERALVLREAARLLREDADAYAELIAEEMGKPLGQGRAESEKCAWVCEHYAAHAADYLRDEAVPTDASLSVVACEPLGVLLAIMPWNFPLWQVFRFAAPALMAGNAVLIKHAPNVTGCARAIESLLPHCGAPRDLLRVLMVDVEAVERVIDHPLVRAVTFTGSRSAGSAVAQAAGRALKKSVLELGGSDPYVVFADADVEAAADACAASRLINSGQSCVAAKRFIVVDAVRERFERRFVEQMAGAVVGDPLDPRTTVGPLARADLRDALVRQVGESLSRGARVIAEAAAPSGAGFFAAPTVLADVRPGMPAFDEETFGPVAALVGARDDHEALALANASRYGLGAALFTRDIERALALARRELQAGCVFINALVKSDPRLPIGGIKESGYGRELGSYGIREFVNVKTIYAK